jgi:hypothetical protein
MEAHLISFGQIEVDGRRYDHDVVIDRGVVRRRKKGPSKPYRDRYGHTPLSPDEAIPWPKHGPLVIGTGASGQLPVMPEVVAEAADRGVEIKAAPTREACRMLAETDAASVAAILHVTC